MKPASAQARGERPGATRSWRVAALLTLGLALSMPGLAGVPRARADATSARERRAYLAEMAFVLEGTRRTLSWTERYLRDGRMGQFAQPLAEQYVRMAGRMIPPIKLKLVHPHLLLIAENVERAVAAAAHSDLPAFRQRRRVVREEIRTLEGILKHLNVRLPELAR